MLPATGRRDDAPGFHAHKIFKQTFVQDLHVDTLHSTSVSPESDMQILSSGIVFQPSSALRPCPDRPWTRSRMRPRKGVTVNVHLACAPFASFRSCAVLPLSRETTVQPPSRAWRQTARFDRDCDLRSQFLVRLKNRVSHTASAVEEDKPPTVHLLLPPAVEEPGSSHTSTLRNASARASAFSKCLFHSSCRAASRFTVFCSLVVVVASPLGISYLPQRPGWFHLKTDADFLVHLHELAVLFFHAAPSTSL